MSKHAKVWAVEQGEYSDYRIIGVFSTRANAKRVEREINAKDSYSYQASVVEWSLDPGIEEMNAGRSMYRVLMLRDGNAERVQRFENPHSYPGAEETHRIWRRSTAPAFRGTGILDVLECDVWAVDDAHAVKIANERRLQMIAGGKWSAPTAPHGAGPDRVDR